MITTFRRAIVLMAVCACAASARAQEPRPADVPQMPVLTRRLRKHPERSHAPTSGLKPESTAPLRRAMDSFRSSAESFPAVDRGRPWLSHRLFGDRAIVRAVGRCIATTLHDDALRYRVATAPPPPSVARRQVKYQDFTQINFFGIGSRSLKSDRTDYRLKISTRWHSARCGSRPGCR
jgi:hypothetical protein